MPASMDSGGHVLRRLGGPRKAYVSVPLVRDLLSEPGPKYFVTVRASRDSAHQPS